MPPLVAGDAEGSPADRVIGDISTHGMRLEDRDPRTLTPNPLNHRRHPNAQRNALHSSIDDIGWVLPVVFNERTGLLIDERNLDTVPTLVLDLDPADEQLALAVLDRMVGMASIDRSLEEVLMSQLADRDSELAQLIANIGDEHYAPRERRAESSYQTQDIGVGLVPGEAFNYVTLLFKSETDWGAAIAHFGLHPVMDPFMDTKRGINRVVDGGDYLKRAIQHRGDDVLMPEPPPLLELGLEPPVMPSA